MLLYIVVQDYIYKNIVGGTIANRILIILIREYQG